MREKLKKILPAVLFAAGLALIVTGLVLGQNRDVLGKAIRICTECIGLG